MRELKFRAWAYASRCWIDGLYIGGDGDIASYDESDWSLSQNLQNVIVEQYTGLKDKNGKEIYEGDIVRWCGGFYEIYFDIVQGWRGIDRRGSIPNGHTLYQMTINNVDKPNIVGNIHKNPELLGGEE